MLNITSHSEKDTMNLGKRIAKRLKPGDILCLTGELGSGKTTFVKGLAIGLKVNVSAVHSPTFVVMNIYNGKYTLYHFDMYRLDEIKEIGRKVRELAHQFPPPGFS